MQVMDIQNRLWQLLREAEFELAKMAREDVPKAAPLWQKFMALRRRLFADPPAGEAETFQRLQELLDECQGQFERDCLENPQAHQRGTRLPLRPQQLLERRVVRFVQR